MKKAVIIVVLMSVLLLTGCGKGKKLTCTYNLESEEMKATMEYAFTFDKKGENLNSYVKKDTADYLKEVTDEEFEEDYQNALKSCDDMKDLKGVKCNIEKDGKKISMKLEVKLNDLDSTGKDTLFTREAAEKNYDAFKSMMEETGFTCK